MSKKENVKEAIERLANNEIPKLFEQIMADKALKTDERVALLGLLSTAQHHLRLALARFE